MNDLNVAFSMDSAADFVGVIGVVIYICAYTSLQLGLIRGATYTYATINICAASCVLYSLTDNFNFSAAVIQSSWIVISLVGISRLYLLSKLARFSEEEESVINLKFPKLRRHLARKLFDAGDWIHSDVGTILIREDSDVERILYLSSGKAGITLNGRVLGECESGTFLGEMAALSGKPATATVTLSEPSRYFSIASEKLNKLSKRHPDIKHALETAFAADSRSKLISANLKLTDSSEPVAG